MILNLTPNLKGMAMGKKFGPSYANVFMADREELAVTFSAKKPFAYFGFLDDSWGVWTHSRDDFTLFTHLNAHQTSTRIKYMIDAREVNFLNVVSFKGPTNKPFGF